MSAVPAYADPLTFFPLRDFVADCIDASRNFMTRHTRKLKPRPETFFDDKIAVANTARFHFHANLPRARLRDIAFHQFKISAGFANLRRLHLHPHKMLLSFTKL